MDIISQLASSLGRRDEVPNQQLAKAIAASGDEAAVSELVAVLHHKNKDLQSDAIKVLYEIGEQKPALIAPHWQAFIGLISGKNNRLAWGGMMALDYLTPLRPQEVFYHLPAILAAADAGSVITRDHAVGGMIKLTAMEKFAATVFPLLLEQLAKCPANQLAMYAERALPAISPENKEAFRQTLASRLGDLHKESQQKRIEKVLKKLGAR